MKVLMVPDPNTITTSEDGISQVVINLIAVCSVMNLNPIDSIIIGYVVSNDITIRAIADALQEYVDEHGPITTPVVIGRGGPQLVKGLITMKETLESLGLPYVIFGPDTPVTQVAEYAAKLAVACRNKEGSK